MKTVIDIYVIPSHKGRTETIDNTLDPQWVKKFVLDYQFEMRQMLRVTVFDSDRGAVKLEDNDLIGTMECSLGEVVAADGAGLTRKLEGKKDDQTITMVAEELVASREVVKLKLIGKNLERKDWCGFGSSDPFLTILRANDPGQWFVVHRTEVMKGDLSPDWLPLEMTVSTLCNADHNRPLKLRVEDWNVSGSHDLIGEVETTLADLMELQPGSQMPLVNPKKRSKGKKYKNSGVLVLISHLLEERPTFLDYIQGGMELSFTVAIDFTASNGNPASSNSLHHVDPKGKPNQYLVAIKAVGDIIQDYDTDQMFPALGFGARLPPCGQVQHDFFLNMSSESPYCKGVDGIVDAYHQALDSVELYGPTNFAPVINHVAKIATLDKRQPSNYQVLLIITDGIITDMEATKAAIIAASDLPMSIIIIGVGSVNFAPMEELDSDRQLLQLGKIAKSCLNACSPQALRQQSGTSCSLWS